MSLFSFAPYVGIRINLQYAIFRIKERYARNSIKLEYAINRIEILCPKQACRNVGARTVRKHAHPLERRLDVTEGAAMLLRTKAGQGEAGMNSGMTISELHARLVDFRDRRDWKKFHRPKDLALSISIESAELLELFQWKSDEEIEAARAAGELAVRRQVIWPSWRRKLAEHGPSSWV